MKHLASLTAVVLIILGPLDPSVNHTQAANWQLKTVQEAESKPTQEPVAEEEQTEQEAESPTDGSDEPKLVEVPQPELNRNEIRLHMFDGTIITGNLSSQSLTLTTDYGTLNIPMDEVLEVKPGLDSYPQLQVNIERLVDELGAPDYNARLAARKKLSDMGLRIKLALEEFDGGGNAERKKHLDELKREIQQLEIEALEFDDEIETPLIRGDSVRTPHFTAVGKIQQESFQVQSKYGELAVSLQDIKLVDRQKLGGSTVRRTLEVSGDNHMLGDLKSSGIRVNRGDEITISASGSITMTPWGAKSVSNPEGSSRFGWFENNTIPSGALCAQIGDSGQAILVGRRIKFKAEQSGVLKFGIGIPANYARGNYKFPGRYRLKIEVASGNR